MALRKVLQQAVSASSFSTANVARAYSTVSNKYVNHIELLGRVGAEPRKIGVNEAVAFPLFTESSVKLKDGTSKVYTCWHKVLCVRKALGEIVFNNVERGQRVYISGRLAYKAPETTDQGKLMHSHQAAVIADSIIFLEKSRKNQDHEESREEPPKESIVS